MPEIGDPDLTRKHSSGVRWRDHEYELVTRAAELNRMLMSEFIRYSCLAQARDDIAMAQLEHQRADEAAG